jgi:phosphotransferase system HPr (HPr) family protein
MPPPSEKKRAEYTIGNELGLHFRAAALVVRALEEFSSNVTISTDETTADARSILDLMTLVAAARHPRRGRGRGRDADAALAALGRLIAENFGE